MKIHPPVHLAFSSTPGPASELEHLRDVMRLLGVDVSRLEPLAGFPVALRRLEPGGTLAHEGEPLHSLFIVRCGSLKCVRTLEDGYGQVTALAYPGDVLGFDGMHCGRHVVTEVALESSTVYALPLSGLRALRMQCPALDDAWQRALSRQMAHAIATAEMLAAVAAEVRVARFILWLSVRSKAIGRSPRRLRLSMCRRDLASLLGVAHETVSRSLTVMAEAGLLAVSNRDIEILDHEQLHARARTTRRPGDAAEGDVGHGRPSSYMPQPGVPAHWSAVLQANPGQ